MRSKLVLGVASFALWGALTACGQPEEDERSLVTDQEIGALQEELVPPASDPAQSNMGKSFYVRLSWGLLAGERKAPHWVDWNGSLEVDQGTVQLTHLIFFDRADRPLAQTSPTRIEWLSRTRPHYDGLVARVEVPSDDATLTLATPLFKRIFRASELTGGDDAVFPVDHEGHVVSISSLPANSCPGGFVQGAMRPARAGWLAFGGRTADRTGRFTGRIRFRSTEGGALEGRMVDDSGREVAQVRGTLVREGEGGSFSAELVSPDGRSVGSLTGLYAGPSYSPRGSFQGTYDQVCDQ